MGQLVHIRSGRWEKIGDGSWKFEPDSVERDPAREAPIDLLTSEDIELMMSVKEWNNDVQICVTYGALNVAKYQFFCRTSFKIGENTYLEPGVTEAEHCSRIKAVDMVEEDEITCAGSVLKQLFSEEKLILVYRFSFEIDYARKYFDRSSTGSSGDIIGAGKISEKPMPSHQPSYDGNGEAKSTSDYPDDSIIRLNEAEEPDFFNAEWADMDMSPPMLETGTNLHDNVAAVNDISVVDLDGSSTGSTGHVNVLLKGNTRWNPINVPLNDTSVDGVGMVSERDIYVGMIFDSREEFKQHMAMYAIRNKFRLRNARSSPGGMVLRCFSAACNWRVYAVMLKNTNLYEIRTATLNHSCAVDDRTGYQSQATHTVIGGMMKGKFIGRGGGPRPNDIRQAMQGDHDVHISYWKAWRSRQVALDYAKGSSGASYNLLP
ncbi:unnamed protein product, partial [Brassica rapa]